jgi:peptidoglycan-associated lipoprotein
MGGGKRSAVLTLGSLVLTASLAGCAWLNQMTSSTEEPATAATQPAPEPVTAAPAPVTAAPAAVASTPPAEVVAPAPASNGHVSNGYAELPGLADVRFRSGQVGVVKADHKVLDSLVRWLKENPGTVVMIEGHTDDLGTPQANLVVGEKRAASVMRYLVSRGLEPSRVSATSVGSERPVCTEKTDTCRAKNRRARFLVKQR